jgi:hypothetical protein
MYIESKATRAPGPAHIGLVAFSKSGATLYYAGRSFQKLPGTGVKSNYICIESDERYWICDPRADGQDNPDAANVTTEVDADIHDEYWSTVRGLPVPPRRRDEPA